MREVLVWETVHNRLWQNLPKDYYDRMVKRLFEQLENHYDRLRGRRHPEDETYFVLTLHQPVGEDWHTFEFIVDDTIADTCLIVADVIHTLGKTRLR